MKSSAMLILCLLAIAACSSSKSTDAGNTADGSCIHGIIGGQSVDGADLFARKVALLIASNDSITETCTATPISSDTLLTAAHCVQPFKNFKVAFHTELNCASGFNASNDLRRVVAARAHEKYTGATKKIADVLYDVALVKIEGKIPSDYSISKIYDGNSDLQSGEVTMAGYGKTTETSKALPKLYKLTKNMKETISTSESPQQLLMNQPDGGICEGDSGGPQFVLVNGQYQILAVNSAVAANSNLKSYCHGFAILMYAPFFADWIARTTATLR